MILALLLSIVPSEDLAPDTREATRWLFKSVEAGDVAMTKRALKMRGLDLNARTIHGAETPLMLAANAGSVELVKLLLAAGADPNVAPHSRYHHGPLFYALMGSLSGGEKSLEQVNAVVKALLDAKANPNLEMMEGEFMPRTTPTLVAAKLMPETLALLLAGGGDAAYVQSDGKDALAVAADDKDPETALKKLDLVIGAGVKVPADEKKRVLLLARSLDAGGAPVARKLLAAGCTVAPGSELAGMLLGAVASSGDASLYDELSKGVRCKGDFVAIAFVGLKADDKAKRERVLGLSKRLQACGAGMKGASAMAARAGDTDAFTWAVGLEKELPDGMLRDAATGGEPAIVARLLERGQSPDGTDGPLVLAAKNARAKAVELMWPKASSATREQALSAAVDASCASDRDLTRVAALFGAFARLGLETVPEKVRGCSAEGWLAFHDGRRELEAARGGTREYDALVFGGDAASAEGWETGAKAVIEKASPWLVPLGAYPRRVRSDAVSGMNPGFDVVLMGYCPPEQSGSRLDALKAFYAGVYVKRISAPAAELGCPLVLEQPLVSATKSGKAGPDTVTVSILRKGQERSCVGVKISAKGELTGFASEVIEARSCGEYDESVALDGCTVRCGGKTKRVKLKLK